MPNPHEGLGAYKHHLRWVILGFWGLIIVLFLFTTAYTVPTDSVGIVQRFGKYVRTDSVLTLEDAVRKMSGATAARLKLRDRGLLREGMFADVVVFDEKKIQDVATFEKPHQLSLGVEQVLVNGVLVVADGKHTGATPGRVVRGPGYARE